VIPESDLGVGVGVALWSCSIMMLISPTMMSGAGHVTSSKILSHHTIQSHTQDSILNMAAITYSSTQHTSTLPNPKQ
jgi:hypothetical protein